ncbi:MAG: hypothetical protein B6242_15835 [Anaerolineaceae bacterium 4572_78]|nr:MAG: hypothetical protein B6242_15835 [Anaerolineaceae bacterium 4572_78]
MTLTKLEQQLLNESPHWIYLVLTTSEDGFFKRGVVQSVKEHRAFVKFLANHEAETPLIQDVISAQEDSEVDGPATDGLAHLRLVANILNTKVAEEEATLILSRQWNKNQRRLFLILKIILLTLT